MKQKSKSKITNSPNAKSKMVSNHAPKAMTTAKQLTKEERKQLERHIKKLTAQRKPSVQKTIPYLDMYPDGICQLTENTYSRTIRFYDINYALSTPDEKENVFSKYCDILNYFDDSIHFQLTFENQNTNLKTLQQRLNIAPANDDFDDIRAEYSGMLQNQLLHGTNGKKHRSYLTFTIEANSLSGARTMLDGIAEEVTKLMRDKLKVQARVMDGKDRLSSLYRSMNPYSKESLIFDWDIKRKSGLSTKDFIVPPSMNFKKSTFQIGNAYGAVYGFHILAGELSDRILSDFLSDDNILSFNFHVQPFDQVEALKFVRGKLTDVERMKIDEQKKAVAAGYDSDILPPNIKLYLEDLNKILADLNTKNERLFHVAITIRNYASSPKVLKLQQDKLIRLMQKNNCKLFPLDYLQEQALGSSLTLGVNHVPISRDLTTSALAVFIPFTTNELFQNDPAATYYGANALSKNMIMAARWLLKNPNGLFLGTPGSGKSFSIKREITDIYLKRPGDDIFVCDPEGEYFPLIQRLHGQVIKISTAGTRYINPMDISFDAPDDEDPIANKSDFILSLCELIIGGRYGLDAEERSVIDRCVKKIYTLYQENPIPERMPILEDLQNELKQSGEIAERIANSLEMYVTGSQNFFNHRTNVDIQNRLVCFDIRDLSKQLRKIGMLVLQDQVWNRVAENRNLKKKTWYYIDEFHLLLKEEQTAKYSVEMWKRFRKWGGIPTGITQNVKDLLSSREIENIFENSDFVYLLNQAAGDREILAESRHLSAEQTKYITNTAPGEGLILYDGIVLPFVDKFPTDTELYKLMNTKPEEAALTAV